MSNLFYGLKALLKRDKLSEPSKNLVLLGGIPRSGTTLTCTLLNNLEDTLAMVEPMDMAEFLKAGGEEGRAQFINHFSHEIRVRAVRGEPIAVKSIEGEQSNTFSSRVDEKGKRKEAVSNRRDGQLDKSLNSGFYLLIKHPNAFAALLPELKKQFRIFMHVRNPLSILASWNSLEHPLSQGRAPMAERFDSSLAALLKGIDDSLDRQITLLNWYYDQFQMHLKAEHIIRYEDVVATGGKSLRVIVPAARGLDEPLRLRNANHLYNKVFMEQAGDRLLGLGGSWQGFYENSEIERVLREIP